MSEWANVVYNGTVLTDYFINTNGKIINMKEKEITPRCNNRGYWIIDLYPSYKLKKTMLVHRLVAETFIPNPNNEKTVNHIDGNKNNNTVSNLEWVSYGVNNQLAYDTGLHKHHPGLESPFAKYSENDIRLICKMLEVEKSPKLIAEKTQLPLSLIKSIKSHLSWTCISKDYTFIDTNFSTDDNLRKQIYAMHRNGLSLSEICSNLHWGKSTKYKKRVMRAIKRIQNQQNVQRLSKGPLVVKLGTD